MSNKFRQQYADAKGAIIEKPGVGIILAAGTTVPADATAGFASGGIFMDTDAAAGLQFFINEGTNLSADFNPIDVTATSTTSAARTFTGGVTLTTVGLTITDVDIALSTGTGTKIGTATNQKLGFYNATPVAQRSAYTQTYSTADKTVANPTAAALTVSDGAGTNDGTIGAITADASVIAAVQELAAQINKLVADEADTKQALNSVIDDLQALGLVG